MPDGLITANGDLYYAEYPPGTGVRSLGVAETPAGQSGPEGQKTRDEVKNELF